MNDNQVNYQQQPTPPHNPALSTSLKSQTSSSSQSHPHNHNQNLEQNNQFHYQQYISQTSFPQQQQQVHHNRTAPNTYQYQQQQNQQSQTQAQSKRISPAIIPVSQPHYLYPSQSQSLYSYNSEWVDTPNNSPSVRNRYINLEMSSTQVATADPAKFETPYKTRGAFAYISPMADKQGSSVINLSNATIEPASVETAQTDIEKSVTPQAQQLPPKTVKSWDIFWVMLNDIVGKDKMAKIGQYTLRLLIYHAERTETFLSDPSINIGIINARYNNKEKKLNLIANFLKHPSDFIRIIVILACSIFRQRFAGMVAGLSMYRQFLRFGKTPFRIRGLANKLTSNISYRNKDLKINYPNIMNRKTLGEVFSLYYGINDESLLLYKLKFLSSSSYHKFVSRHESFAWYSETWLALYNAYENLHNLTQQEMDVRISIQVKSKAKLLSRQLLGSGAGNTLQNKFDFSSVSSSSNEDLKNLSDIQFKKNNAWLDIYKNISDLIFNTYTVFRLPLPFDTIQMWMGISASVLSTVKLYRETKKIMIEKA